MEFAATGPCYKFAFAYSEYIGPTENSPNINTEVEFVHKDSTG